MKYDALLAPYNADRICREPNTEPFRFAWTHRQSLPCRRYIAIL